MTSQYKNDEYCKGSDDLARLGYPMCYVFEDKAFGSEMCYGRGACDTDPSQRCKVAKSCRKDLRRSIPTFNMNVDEVGLKDSVDKDKERYVDFETENEIEQEFLKDPKNYIPPFGFRPLVVTAPQDPTQILEPRCGEKEQKPKEKLMKLCVNNSPVLAESFKMNAPEALIDSIHSSMANEYFFENLQDVPYRKLSERVRPSKRSKLAGPFTEPPNPGVQMKLGEFYHKRIPVKKDFYT